MLKSLRRIDFPPHLQTSGPVIKASLIRHVKDHTDLIAQAKTAADELLESARVEANRLRSNIQTEVAQSLKKDLELIRVGTQQKEKALYERTSELCTEVCNAVFQQVLQNLPAQEKVRALVEILLGTAHHGRVLQLCCHPDQTELVENEVGKVMAEQMNMRQWKVKSSHELQAFEIVISTPNGAEIQVSLDNLLAIYKDEIDALKTELMSVIQMDEEHHENIS